MGAYCKFVCGMAADGALDAVEQFQTFWTAFVDPKAVQIAPAFFDELYKCTALLGHPKLRLHMAMSMYTMDHAATRSTGQPASAGLISSACLSALCKPEVRLSIGLCSSKVRVACRGTPPTRRWCTTRLC